MVDQKLTHNKAHCLIVSANQVVTPYPVYPLGAAYLVTALKKHGHQVTHFDILADGGHEKLQQLLVAQSYDLIGVSIRNLDSVDSAAPDYFMTEIMETVSVIRGAVSTPIVLGGPAFSILPEAILNLLQADYGVVGEGEEILPWLATEVAAGRRPDQKLFFAEPTIGLWQPSELTPTTAKYYIERGGMLNVQTKRGCPYECSYCSYPTIEGRKIRYRDPDEVAEEVQHLHKHSGAKYVFFADSFFNDPEGRYLQVAEALIRRGNTLPWCAFFRPQNLGVEELRLLKKAGLAAMEMGTDAACDATLAGIGKRFTFAEVLEVQNRIVQAEIPSAHFVMFGGPGETPETLKEGLENLDKLEKCVVFAFVGIRILPGTGIFSRAVADGIIRQEDPLLHPVFYFSPQVTRETIVAAIQGSFSRRPDRVYPCHEFDKRIQYLHQIGYAGPLWDLIMRKRSRR